MKLLYGVVTLVLAFICFSGCSHKSHDSRLLDIDALVSEHPEEAVVRLDSIDKTSLSGADRHFHDFLKVKARDKAYIRHASDSLILDVIDYYRRHEKVRYLEALYYGGRVYSDMGDYPTALQYFHEALENMPADSKDYDLKCRILSQTGRLLDGLRLYKEAVPYIEQAIDIGKEQRDTINVVYDLQLLGVIYLRADEYNSAEKYLKEALRMSGNLPDSYIAKSEMSLALLKYKTGQLDSALLLVRGIPERVRSITRSTALDYACSIYYSAGILDTAIMYAKELISSPHSDRRDTGYYTLLLPKCRPFIPSDTLYKYISDYRSCIETFLNHNEHNLALTQQSKYNYSLHEKARIQAETSQKRLKLWLIYVICSLLILMIIILYLKNRNKSRVIQLQQAIDNIRQLKEELAKEKESFEEDNRVNPIVEKEDRIEEADSLDLSITSNNSSELIPTKQQLRDELLKEFILLLESNERKVTVLYQILDSDITKKLNEQIEAGKILRPDDELWIEIEDMVLENSPEFKKRLHILTYGNISTVEYQTALLIKCNIRPLQIAHLLGKSKGAIISRRETLSHKIFDKKISIKNIDNLIHLL